MKVTAEKPAEVIAKIKAGELSDEDAVKALEKVFAADPPVADPPKADPAPTPPAPATPPPGADILERYKAGQATTDEALLALSKLHASDLERKFDDLAAQFQKMSQGDEIRRGVMEVMASAMPSATAEQRTEEVDYLIGLGNFADVAAAKEAAKKHGERQEAIYAAQAPAPRLGIWGEPLPVRAGEIPDLPVGEELLKAAASELAGFAGVDEKTADFGF